METPNQSAGFGATRRGVWAPRGLCAHTRTRRCSASWSALGLRIGEAIRLRNDEVDLLADPPRLSVIKTKFGKSRLVPLHSTTAKSLDAYAEQRRSLNYDGKCESFFVSERPSVLNYRVVNRTFVGLAREVGVDVCARVPELSIYLGHLQPKHTYWYLTATPELLGAAARRFEALTDGGGV
ncbi:MAG: tyrosine-type recombinase/integrase [Proteobacteria bacterium]|nr:tyrosine-type recombinase/integrase [Pseudomonadota bacterium]